MNEELQNVIAEFVKTFLETGKEVKDFATMQIPDVIQQALLWYGMYNFIVFMFGIIMLYVMYRLNKFQWQLVVNTKFYDSDYSPVLMINILQGIPLLFVLRLINLEWLKIWIAPKLWLIEFASSLVTNVGGK